MSLQSVHKMLSVQKKLPPTFALWRVSSAIIQNPVRLLIKTIAVWRFSRSLDFKEEQILFNKLVKDIEPGPAASFI